MRKRCRFDEKKRCRFLTFFRQLQRTITSPNDVKLLTGRHHCLWHEQVPTPCAQNTWNSEAKMSGTVVTCSHDWRNVSSELSAWGAEWGGSHTAKLPENIMGGVLFVDRIIEIQSSSETKLRWLVLAQKIGLCGCGAFLQQIGNFTIANRIYS